MKKFISFLTAIIILSSCNKQEILEQDPQLQEALDDNEEISVNFNFNSPECERPEITFKGETYSDITTITRNTTVELRSDQMYTVSFRLKSERCSGGAIILGSENSNEVNLWLGSRSDSATKQHVNLEDKYYVMVQGE